MNSIGTLLGSKGRDELSFLYDAAAELEKLKKPVGTSAFRLATGELQFKEGARVMILDQPMDLTLAVQAGVQIRQAAYETDIFGAGQRHRAPAGRSFAEATLAGQFGASAEAPLLEAPLTLSASGSAAAEMKYRHLIPVLGTQQRLSALKRAVVRSRLPQRVDLGDLTPGEVHRLDAHLKLEFGLKVKHGSELEIDEVVDLFADLSLPIKAHVRFSLEGSLGWSFYAPMSLTVGRANQLNDGWVRIRLERQRKSTLTLGMSLAIQVKYDVASGLEAIFDRALDLVPTPGVLESLQELNQILEEGGGWDAVKTKLSDEATDRVAEWVGDLGWKEWLAGSAQAKKLIGLSQKVVDAYGEIEPAIQGWWKELLAKADLGSDSKILLALDKISKVDPASFKVEQLLDEDWQETIDLLETLSGKRLEDLLVAANQEVRSALERAKKLATEALGFLDDVPAEFISRLRELAKRSGIDSTIAFLKKNTSSKAKLEAAIEDQIQPRIKKLVERLVGKAWDEIRDQDLAQVARWADRASELLEKKKEWDKKIRAELQRLKGEVGFSFGFELERVSQTSALLDLEVDPAAGKLLKKLGKALTAGSAQKLLIALPESEDTDEGDVDPLPYQIREAVFTSSRIRTTTVWVSLFGMRSTKNRRVRESTVRLSQGKSGIVREGSYNGAYYRTEIEKSKSETSQSTAGIAIVTEAVGAGKNLQSAYSRTSRCLRLYFSREDDKTLDVELDGMDAMLGHLGFVGGPGRPLRDELAAHQPQTQLAVQVSLPDAAIGGLTRDLDGDPGLRDWGLDCLNAAHRWYEDKLVTRSATGLKKVPVGLVLAKLITLDEFRQQWTRGLPDFEGWARRFATRMSAGGEELEVRLFTKPIGGRWFPHYISLRSLAARHRPSVKAARRLGRTWRETGKTPSDLEKLSKIAVPRFQRISAYDWDSPLFDFWLTIVRLSRLDPGSLGKAKGLATLRWRAQTSDPWSEPMRWRLPASGVRKDLRAIGVFPIR